MTASRKPPKKPHKPRSAPSSPVKPAVNVPEPPDSPVFTSEGHRRFASLEQSNTELAELLGVSQASVSYYRHGTKTPGKAARDAIATKLGIPTLAWSTVPHAPLDAAPIRDITTTVRPGATSLEEVREELRELRELKTTIGPTLMPSERLKLSDTIAKLLTLQARLEKEQLHLEDWIVRHHPGWKRMRDSVVAALERFPDAQAAVIEAIA